MAAYGNIHVRCRLLAPRMWCQTPWHLVRAFHVGRAGAGALRLGVVPWRRAPLGVGNGGRDARGPRSRIHDSVVRTEILVMVSGNGGGQFRARSAQRASSVSSLRHDKAIGLSPQAGVNPTYVRH